MILLEHPCSRCNKIREAAPDSEKRCKICYDYNNQEKGGNAARATGFNAEFNPKNWRLATAAKELFGASRIRKEAHGRYVKKDFTLEEQAAIRVKAQICEADADLDAAEAEVSKVEAEAASVPGFNESPTLVRFVQEQVQEKKRRIGQERWKRELHREDSKMCVVSDEKEAIEASHLNYPGKGLSLRGVTLRRDLASHFDYYGAKLTTREDGTIFWDKPGHEFHGKTLRLSQEKAKAISAELTIHRPKENQ